MCVLANEWFMDSFSLEAGVYPSWHHVGRWALHGLIEEVSLVFWKATYPKTTFNTTQCKSTSRKFLGVFGVHLTAMDFLPRKDEEKMRDLP
jgi:hypothetical protein